MLTDVYSHKSHVTRVSRIRHPLSLRDAAHALATRTRATVGPSVACAAGLGLAAGRTPASSLDAALPLAPPAENLVQRHRRAARHVERVFDAEDRDLHHGVALLHHGLVDPRHLVAEHDGDAAALVAQLRRDAERDRVLRRLQRNHVHAARAKMPHRRDRRLEVVARHRRESAERRFLELAVGRRGGEATRDHATHPRRVGRPED
mmetsp:Transcript_11865/g.34741  ORF Transcript_11865/g.34741 Transcript_11865/m.34741 type:complete len:205 (-) Transcript_11865:664-1278(-)